VDPPRPTGVVEFTPDKVMADLEVARIAALADKAFSNAIRCSELQGRHIGMWRDMPASQGRTLEEMIAGVKRLDDGNGDGG
jgi:hypothetical protein